MEGKKGKGETATGTSTFFALLLLQIERPHAPPVLYRLSSCADLRFAARDACRIRSLFAGRRTRRRGKDGK